jgi:hypothetical protein
LRPFAPAKPASVKSPAQLPAPKPAASSK